jgi:hypothetical protein
MLHRHVSEMWLVVQAVVAFLDHHLSREGRHGRCQGGCRTALLISTQSRTCSAIMHNDGLREGAARGNTSTRQIQGWKRRSAYLEALRGVAAQVLGEPCGESVVVHRRRNVLVAARHQDQRRRARHMS